MIAGKATAYTPVDVVVTSHHRLTLDGGTETDRLHRAAARAGLRIGRAATLSNAPLGDTAGVSAARVE